MKKRRTKQRTKLRWDPDSYHFRELITRVQGLLRASSHGDAAPRSGIVAGVPRSRRSASAESKSSAGTDGVSGD